MTVYVDSARIPAKVGRVTGRWSHLTADTREELEAFAARLGLRPEWLQTCKTRCGREGEPCPHWHYDVTVPVRLRALELGAQPIDMRDLSRLLSDRRAAYRATTQRNLDSDVPQIPAFSLDITGLTATRDDNPTSGIQYCVVDESGVRHAYGDQAWVVSGQAVIDAHPGGRVEQRTVTIIYGEWASIPSDTKGS